MTPDEPAKHPAPPLDYFTPEPPPGGLAPLAFWALFIATACAGLFAAQTLRGLFGSPSDGNSLLMGLLFLPLACILTAVVQGLRSPRQLGWPTAVGVAFLTPMLPLLFLLIEAVLAAA
jgi:hypothetical protein